VIRNIIMALKIIINIIIIIINIIIQTSLCNLNVSSRTDPLTLTFDIIMMHLLVFPV